MAVTASSRTISPRAALALIVTGAFAGPFLFGTAVAHTTGSGVADFNALGPRPLFAAIAGALVTVGCTYATRVPTSLSAALFASMVGSLAAGPGVAAVQWSGIVKVAATMAGSVLLGAAGGTVAYRILSFVLTRVGRPAGERLMRLQALMAFLLSAGYGSNDLEKSAGLLAAASPDRSFEVTTLTLALAACGFAVGLVVGGVRVARTVGGKLFAIRPPQALAAESAAAATVIAAALAGGPLSTTDTSASALVGVGAAVNPRAIRWSVVGHIATAWMVTVPAALVAGALASLLTKAL